MPIGVPYLPTPQALRPMETGQPVSSTHGQRWDRETLFQLAHAVPPVWSGWLSNDSASGTAVVCGYQRSPDVQVLYVAAEVWDAGASDSIKVGLTFNGSAATLLPPNTLDGSFPLACPASNHRAVMLWEQFVDVTGLSAASIADLAIKWTSAVGGKGLARVHVAEVPLADANPAQFPATEPGADGAWPNPPNQLYAGTTTGPRGFQRLLAQLDVARAQVRLHRQLATWESTALAWHTSATSLGALSWPSMGVFDPKFSLRARRLYETTTPENVVFRGRYLAVSGGQIAVTINGVQTAVNLPASASFTPFTATATTIPCSTTNQELLGLVTWQGKTNLGANPLYVSQLGLWGNET